VEKIGGQPPNMREIRFIYWPSLSVCSGSR